MAPLHYVLKTTEWFQFYAYLKKNSKEMPCNELFCNFSNVMNMLEFILFSENSVRAAYREKGEGYKLN